MTPGTPLHSAKLADQLVAIDVFSELLASTDPQQLGRRLTEQLRELTGARTVALVEHPAAGAPHALLHVCPERRAAFFTTAELDLFCPECTPANLPPLAAQLPSDHPLRVAMQRLAVESLLRVPLRVRGEVIATLLLVDLPEAGRINEVATIVRHLAPVIGLALKNAFAQERIAQQALALQAQTLELERRVAQRTAALEEANRSLTASQLGALKLMEEAVAARERAEQTNAALQREISERQRAEETLAWEAALVENSADVCSIKDLDLRVRAVNKAFLSSAGLATAAEALGKTDAEIFGRPGNEADIEGCTADERRAQQLPPGEYISRLETLIRPDGTEQVLLTRKFPVFNPSGQLIATANISSDVTEHQRLEEALHRNELRYRLLFSSNVAGVALHEIVCDAAGLPCDYRFLEVNPAFEQLTGLQSAALVGHTVLEVMPQTEPIWIERYGRVALTGAATHFDQFSTVLNRHYEVSAYCPQPGQFAVLVLDITERKRAEAALRESLREKEALLKEVHHRVKNNLQVISSLLRLEAGRIADPGTQSVLRDMQNRIRTMALLHESLYRSGNLAEVDMKAYLETLCQQLFRAAAAYSSGPIELQLAVDPMRLELNRTVPCGLIVNELVSNCLKHAFPAGRGGRIRVELHPTSVLDEWGLSVSDDGVGLPSGFNLENLPSLGLQLVSDLSRQLQGRMAIASHQPGLPPTQASSPEAGACFTVYFKALPPESRPTS